MSERIPPPDLQEAESLLTELFKEVTEWEGTLAGGTTLDVGGETIDSVLQTKVVFGNPKDNLIQLTEELFSEAGVELNYIRQEQIRESHDFYYMTVTVDMRPKPGAQFKKLCCELHFGPKGEDEPIVQTIFPKSKWRAVLRWGGGMNLGLNQNLSWRVGVDASKIPYIARLGPELKGDVGIKNKLKSFVVIHDYAYDVGRFDIAAYGESNSECYWFIQDPNLQKKLTVQFGIVFKVPKGTESITLQGIAWAEPKMSWLVANVRNVRRHLSDQFKKLFRRKEEASNQFSRGAHEKWHLTLPRKAADE